MSDKMREAFNALIAQGHMVGFDDFRTGWESHEALADHSGDADEMVPPVKDSLTADSQQPAAVVELTDEEMTVSREAWGTLMKLVNAANELDHHAEEYDFDDGMGRGAAQCFWDDFSGALIDASDVIAKQGGGV